MRRKPRLTLPGALQYVIQRGDNREPCFLAEQDYRRHLHYINKTYRRTGTLWEGRCKASLVDSEANLLTCMRYIDLTPLRAAMVEHPGEYKWSSYGADARGWTEPGGVTPSTVHRARLGRRRSSVRLSGVVSSLQG